MTHKNFAEFHATVTKKMPDAVLYPEMYGLCYDLMKMTWEAAQASATRRSAGALADIASWGEDNGARWCRETARKAIGETK